MSELKVRRQGNWNIHLPGEQQTLGELWENISVYLSTTKELAIVIHTQISFQKKKKNVFTVLVFLCVLPIAV